MLYIAPEFRDQVRAIAPLYISFEDASLGLESELKSDARRYDTPALAREVVAFSLAALDVLRGADLAAVLARGPGARRATRRAPRVPRLHRRAARTHDARGVGERRPRGGARPPKAADVVVRNLPGTPYVRASVGAWSSEDDLDRLLAAL